MVRFPEKGAPVTDQKKNLKGSPDYGVDHLEKYAAERKLIGIK
jgi:hypothetical protein